MFQILGVAGGRAGRVRHFRAHRVHANEAGQGEEGGGPQGLPSAHLRKRHCHPRAGKPALTLAKFATKTG